MALTTSNDVLALKAVLETIDKKIEQIQKEEENLSLQKKERDRVQKKHGLPAFILKSIVFSVIWYAILQILYVFFPKDFPYYYLCFIFGILTEYIWKKKWEKEELKPILKGIDGKIKNYEEEINKLKKEIIEELSVYAKAKTDSMSDSLSKDMITNLYILDYIAESNGTSPSRYSFLRRYNEFKNIYDKIKNDEENEEYRKLKEKIDKEQEKAIQREEYIKKITEEEKEKKKRELLKAEEPPKEKTKIEKIKDLIKEDLEKGIDIGKKIIEKVKDYI